MGTWSFTIWIPRRQSLSRARLRLSAFALCLLGSATASAGVAINEIYYHPASPYGRTHEFVELHNTGPDSVEIGGWRLRGGVDFEFPDTAVLPASGYVVVTGDREAFLAEFGVAGELVFGDFEGDFDNGGERVLLTDPFNATVDVVVYDDAAPWPQALDGEPTIGTSLQRRCASGESHLAENWSGDSDNPPTPLTDNVVDECPAPVSPPPAIVITEVYYHPEGDNDFSEEFVEIYNPGDKHVSLANWRLEDAVRFQFPGGALATMPPKSYLAICRDEDYVRTHFGITNAIGNFSGALSNRRDRVALADASGNLVDVAFYRDRGDWPASADGFGCSLERTSLTAPGYDPASWRPSSLRIDDGEFRTSRAIGRLDVQSNVLLLGIHGAGECIVDNVRLVPVAQPEVDLVIDGDFEALDVDTLWTNGNTSLSLLEDGVGVDGTRALRLISTADCPGGCKQCTEANSVSLEIDLDEVAPEIEYELSIEYRHVWKSGRLFARVPDGVELALTDAEILSVSPGRENTGSSLPTPVLLSHRGRFPQLPTPEDTTWISVRARAPDDIPVTSVTLTYTTGGEETIMAMLDDGGHRDGLPEDGTYGAELPAFPHNTQVLYGFGAETVAGFVSSSPPPLNSEVNDPSERWGYYVSEAHAESTLRVFHLILPEVNASDPDDISRVIDCDRTTQGAFAVDGELYPGVEIRHRGKTACLVRKRNLKIKFRRERPFEGQRKLNLQAMWTDKALVRERLAWELIGSLGAPFSKTEYVRVHVNGVFHGLFLALEHPDERFLERVGFDNDGLLYKAKSVNPQVGVERQDSLAEYADAWEEETKEDCDFADVGSFIDNLHKNAQLPGGSTIPFMERLVIPELVIGFQVYNVLLQNTDSTAKNHFLYRDDADGRWGILIWDLDLSFGKFFNDAVRGPGREVGTLNDCLRNDSNDVGVWSGTTSQSPVAPVNRLQEFFFRTGEGFYRRAYLVRLLSVLREKYTDEYFSALLEEIATSIESDAADDFDRWGRYPPDEQFVNCVFDDDRGTHVRLLRRQISRHREFLLDNLEASHPVLLDHARLKITEVLYDPAGTSEALEFVELVNTAGRAIDVSAWSLTGAIDYTFPDAAVVEAGAIIVVVKSRSAFSDAHPDVPSETIFGDYSGKLSNEGERLLLRDVGPGFPATIDVVTYDDEAPWPQVQDGHSIELTRPRPNRDNDQSANWVASAGVGGTPGSLPKAPFLRGDTNDDARLNLADPIFLLEHLFKGGRPPACTDGADVNDDGTLDIADTIYLLSFLFRGGEQPREPYPNPGLDPTQDQFVCY